MMQETVVAKENQTQDLVSHKTSSGCGDATPQTTEESVVLMWDLQIWKMTHADTRKKLNTISDGIFRLYLILSHHFFFII